MEKCGRIGDTQQGQNYIYLIYDGIHYNALKLNDEQVLPGNDTTNVKSGKKEKQKRKCDPPKAANTTHTKTTQDSTNDDKKVKDTYNHQQTTDKHETWRAK
jgi:hypothetical protein